MMHKSILELTRNLPRFSLHEMSSFRIITSLCNKRQLLDLIFKCNFQKHLPLRLSTRKGKEWEAVEAMANELISEICNSVLLKKRILEFLWPVSYRIMLWKSIYAPSINNTFLQHFYWTDRGRIDNAKTARPIIGNKNIPARKRFVLACSVCLSEEIHEIWREMSNEDKANIYAEHRDKFSSLLHFWAHTVEGSDNVLEQHMDGALKCSLEIGLLEAVKYLFGISTEDAKRNMASSCMHELIRKLSQEEFLEEDENDIGYFVFFEMTDYCQEDVFNFSSAMVLSLLLHSSEHKHCLNFLAERLQFASENDINVFLQMIFNTYHLEADNGDDRRRLFIEVLQMIPTEIRKSITNTLWEWNF
ncbi:hypothetical protein AVEN_135112-1 [Araneus ventricosus]|uniref:Uncharacterized protein n=1 Tax=Araneus ventricosus TaxID=182803 RepID=A0A4Y2JL48_ARAVE|nr:hypothetical protein AVEN_135112-1 [Araneus ventricosus]